MRWLADECVDAAVVHHLRTSGNDTTYMAERAPGATDLFVIRLANEEERLLLTEDKDFGDLVFRQRTAVPGLVLLRIDPEDRALKWERLEAAIAQFGESLYGRHLVVEKARIRSRAMLR
ncbi:MAG TPA: DUF5615 family PIN-like protein [Stellaceae bacterium]|nr:DUF5615 family PIN-like protein [Stellaceae bacterium]